MKVSAGKKRSLGWSGWLLFHALNRNHVVLGKVFTDLPDGIIFRRMTPSVQRLHALPAQDDNAALRQRAVNLRSWPCRHVHAAALFQSFLSSGKVFLSVSFRVCDLLHGTHVYR